MIHRYTKIAFAVGLSVMVAGCHHNNVSNPIANVDSKQPDKVLFDRAMDAMKHGKYDVARITLQTLINTYPDSEFIARAKLAVGDSWYAEGTAAAYQQAEVEYKDFETFFPNMPEAAEAQLRIADMHYKQMEKADRDYTHAMRAEDEYRNLIQQYPENTKLVPIAKQRLREVQEVLAERQYRIGRFYFLRESYPAAIARLKTLTDTYPLYSQADDALMMLGQAYENEIAVIKSSKMPEAAKMRVVKEYDAKAGAAYARLIERYPGSGRADDARNHLKDLGLPIPTPTKDAIAEYKAEEATRSELGHFAEFMNKFHKAPDDLVRASKVGEPPLIDPQQASAPDFIRAATTTAMGLGDSGNSNVTVEKGPAAPTAGDPVPHSEPIPGTAAASAPGTAPETAASGSGTSAAAAPATPPTNSDPKIEELAPNNAAAPPPTPVTGDADTSARTASSAANTASTTPPQAPAQVNEIQNQSANGTASTADSSSSTSASGSSSSKKKKKKGLKKIVPF